MYRILVVLQAFLLIVITFLNAQAEIRLDPKAEAEFCSMLEKKPVFTVAIELAEKHNTPIEALFLAGNCLNNSSISEVADMKTVYPLTLIAGDPKNNMIFFEQLVKYFELEKKLDAYQAIMNRQDPSGRTILDIVEEQIAAVIKEGTDRALLNMHGFIRADMCYRGGQHTLEASAKLCDNYPTKIYAWCARTFDSDSLGLCLGYRGKIPEKLMMLITRKCIKLRDDEEKQKACLKPLQYSDNG